MNRRKFDRAMIFAVLATLLILLLLLIDAKRNAGAAEVLRATTGVDISETEELLPRVCDFGGCPVEKPVTTEAETEAPTEPETEEPSEALIFEEEYQDETEDEYDPPETYGVLYSPSYFRTMGMISWGGWTWTWYSERVLPGGGLAIPGRYTDAQGYVRDGDGYLCLASEALPWGTVVDTPFGSPGKVYDSGCDYDIIDVYVGW